MKTPVYIGFGANLADRLHHIVRALTLLVRHPALELYRLSGVYETEPVGVTDQPDFLNGVAGFITELSPQQLLRLCLEIERLGGRERRERWGPRTIDLDLLLYGSAEIHADGLVIPHPRLAERAFVLTPLMEIAPDLCVPRFNKTVRELAVETTDRSQVRFYLDSERLLNLIREA